MKSLSKDELEVQHKILALKAKSGTHSPSILTLVNEIDELNIKVDACFLSNPYATELFMEFFKKELIETNELRNLLEFYPPQNNAIAAMLTKTLKISEDHLFIGNGAIEVIQAVLNKFVKGKIVVNIPTFSSYYEFIEDANNVVYYKLVKENNYTLDPVEYVDFIQQESPDTIVIINPNNPNGDYVPIEQIRYILDNLSWVNNIIIDESFIHFAYENMELSMMTSNELCEKYDNLIVIKSMSKDFGIAGIRAGYGIMHPSKVKSILSNGYLWNVSGLADYFFRLYTREDFLLRYDVVRKKYIMGTLMFLQELSRLPNIKVYPSKANFALIEILDGTSSTDFAINLLLRHGVYVRDCSDKIGLDGEYIRVASRSFEENLLIIEAIKDLLKD